MKSYKIHLIRHGAFEEMEKGAYIGTKDVDLSKDGISELKKLDRDFIYPGTPVIFTSPLKRCLKTCEILYPAIKPIVIDQLSECSFGEWEGLTADDLSDNDEFKQWLAGSAEVKPPKGESGADFTRRVCNMFQDIVDGLVKTGNTECVIVTHGGVIMTLLSVYGLPQAKPFDWATECGCGYTLRVTPSLWMRDRVAEVISRLPYAKKEELSKEDFFGSSQAYFEDFESTDSLDDNIN